MPLIDVIAGARPNFVKIASIVSAMTAAREEGAGITCRVVHTGQHTDPLMSESFFTQLGIPVPDVNLGASGRTLASIAGSIMVGYEDLLLRSPADCCVVVGDVTSTMACAISAKRAGMPVAHVEAGIRSFDMSMPEELNRIVTDSVSDWFFTTSRWAGENLVASGIGDEKVFFVGNTMIDTLIRHRHRFRMPREGAFEGLTPGGYLVLTLHRPANVDDPAMLFRLVTAACAGAFPMPVVFPVHPRTAKRLEQRADWPENLRRVPPLPYLEFNGLVADSLGVLTDSGGITEEATVMGIPCGTLRPNTERPETIEVGTNELLGVDPRVIEDAAARMRNRSWKRGAIPELWDGQSGVRIVRHLRELLGA